MEQKNLSERLINLRNQPAVFEVKSLLSKFVLLPTLLPDPENPKINVRGKALINTELYDIVALSSGKEETTCTLSIRNIAPLTPMHHIHINQPYQHMDKLLNELIEHRKNINSYQSESIYWHNPNFKELMGKTGKEKQKHSPINKLLQLLRISS